MSDHEPKWCPFALVNPVGVGGAAINRDPSGPDPACYCIKSKCAVWVTIVIRGQVRETEYGICGLVKGWRPE